MVLTLPVRFLLFDYRTFVRYSTLRTTITGGARPSKPTVSAGIMSKTKTSFRGWRRVVAPSPRASP
jgi:hypothetical protein